MRDTETAVELVDIQRLMSLFAQGIGGRYFHLKALDENADDVKSHRLPYSAQGLSHNDGNTLMLPQSIDFFPGQRQNLGAYRVAVMHQLGFLEFGTCEFSWARARRNIADLSALPDTPSAQYPTDLELFFHSVQPHQLTRRVFCVVEDYRVDCALGRTYPGLRADLDHLMSHSLTQRPVLNVIDGPASLLEALFHLCLGRPCKELLALDTTGLLEQLMGVIKPLCYDSSDVYTSVRATLAWVHGLQGLAFAGHTDTSTPGSKKTKLAVAAELDVIAEEAETVEFRGDTAFELIQRRLQVEARELLERVLQQTQGSTMSEKLMQQLEDTGIDRVSQGQVSGAIQDSAGLDTPVDINTVLKRVVKRNEFDRSMLRRSGSLPQLATRSYLYDEWDYQQQNYRRGYCRLFEERLRGDSGGQFLNAVRQRHRELLERVRRQFRSARPEAYQRMRGMSDGEEIDLDRAIEAHIDRRAGLCPDDRIYTRRDRARREVSAAFLLDLSASVSTPVINPADLPPTPEVEDDPEEDFRYWDPPPPPEPRRRVIDIEKEAVALMVDALETLGDSYGIYGFSGSGHEKVEYFVAKEFGEPLRASVWGGIEAMRARSSTRMGPAIRHTITKLQREGSRRKVLLLVSDGFPQDIDYGPDRNDREYGIQDTARALQEAERAGIRTFCLTIDRAGHDYLRRMCPDHQYLVIDEVESLPEELGKVYRALTRS